MDIPKGFKHKTYIEVWYSDLAQFAAKHFNCSIEMHKVLDYPNQDTYHTMNVPTDREWEDIWNSDFNDFEINPNRGNEIRAELARGNTDSLTLDILMDLLYDERLIPAGEYLITIWW